MSGNAHERRQGKPGSASNASAMTPGLGFEPTWKELRPRVVSLMRQGGASPDAAEDLAQEAAIRLLNSWHLLDEDRPTWPFVRRVALNCLIDRHRRETLEPLGSLPDIAAPYDVEEQGLARFRLRQAWRAMNGLTQRERAVLLAEVGLAGRHPNDSATKMTRLRARRKLAEAMGPSGAFSGIAVAWRRFTGWLQLNGSTAGMDVATAAGLVVVVSAAAASWSHAGPAVRTTEPAAMRSMEVEARTLNEPSMPKRNRLVAPLQRESNADRERALGKEPSPTPSLTPQPTSTQASAGPARAETGRDGGATYVKICTGEGTQTPHDDAEVTIVVYDGDQEPDDDAPECHREEEEENP